MIAIVTRACVRAWARGVTPGEVDWVWVTLSVDSSSGTWSAFQLDIYLIHVCMSVVMLLLGMSLLFCLFAVRRSSFVFFFFLLPFFAVVWIGWDHQSPVFLSFFVFESSSSFVVLVCCNSSTSFFFIVEILGYFFFLECVLLLLLLRLRRVTCCLLTYW